MIRSVKELNLEPEPDKQYWKSGRNWQEDIIYFLMVDRFHDGLQRNIIRKGHRNRGFGSEHQLKGFCRGNLRGIISQLNYIANLGATAIWLSPVFENNPHSYHGYAIQNYLAIDPRFGTREDLKELVSESHKLGIKIFLDVVINHSGDNWFYHRHLNPVYNDGRQYRFGGWRYDDRPLPLELRQEKFYRRQGMIQNWDDYPETQEGDFFSLKKYLMDESEEGMELQEIMAKIFCWWVKETDCDGFRLDAIKHLGPGPTARFCASVRNYCHAIGKDEFFIFGELPADDETANNYLNYKITDKRGETVTIKGADTILDFPLHYILPKAVKNLLPFQSIIERYRSLNYNDLFRSEPGNPLVTFLDNHDQIEGQMKARLGAQCEDREVIAAVGLLYSLPGVPCLYYGTEQGFSGAGPGDHFIRECMFSPGGERLSVHSQESELYKSFSVLARIRKQNPALIYGTLVFNEISDNGVRFFIPGKSSNIFCFSRLFLDEEILILFNPSTNLKQRVYVKLNQTTTGLIKNSIFGAERKLEVLKGVNRTGTYQYIQIQLDPSEFVILK